MAALLLARDDRPKEPRRVVGTRWCRGVHRVRNSYLEEGTEERVGTVAPSMVSSDPSMGQSVTHARVRFQAARFGKMTRLRTGVIYVNAPPAPAGARASSESLRYPSGGKRNSAGPAAAKGARRRARFALEPLKGGGPKKGGLSYCLRTARRRRPTCGRLTCDVMVSRDSAPARAGRNLGGAGAGGVVGGGGWLETWRTWLAS